MLMNMKRTQNIIAITVFQLRDRRPFFRRSVFSPVHVNPFTIYDFHFSLPPNGSGEWARAPFWYVFSCVQHKLNVCSCKTVRCQRQWIGDTYCICVYFICAHKMMPKNGSIKLKEALGRGKIGNGTRKYIIVWSGRDVCQGIGEIAIALAMAMEMLMCTYSIDT